VTLQEFRDVLLEADPDTKHYWTKAAGNYTTWHEYRSEALAGDDARIGTKWHIQVDRFTKLEYDPMVDVMGAALDAWVEIGYVYRVDYEIDTGYIHHTWDCEVV